MAKKKAKKKGMSLSYAKFKDAVNVLYHAVCQFSFDRFREALFADLDPPSSGYVRAEFRKFQANPLQYFTSLDMAYQSALFEAAKASFERALIR